MQESIHMQYSPFPRRWDLKWSSEYKTKSSMVKVHVSSQMSHLKRDLWWPSRISFSIPMTVSSLENEILDGHHRNGKQNPRWSSQEWKTKSSMVITGLLSNGSFEKRRELWPSRISFCIPMTISSLICSGTGCNYIRLQIGWRWISRLFSKLVQRTIILPMGFTISTK